MKKIISCLILLLWLLTAAEGLPAAWAGKAVDGAVNRKGNNTQEAIRLLQGMTLEEKVGQLLVFGFDGGAVNSHARQMLKEYKAGGVILFDRNMKEPEQVTQLNAALQEEAAGEVPLFICVDQEGGKVVRLRSRVTVPPSQQAISAGGPELARQWAQISGRELKAMGFTVNFAPVLDLAADNSRSYGTDGMAAYQLGRTAVETYHSVGLAAALKHFPGIGKAVADLHVDNDRVLLSKEELLADDIAPFNGMLKAVPHDQYMIMVSHLHYPALDNQPASLSPVIGQMLRHELGYTGVIVTDDLEMAAVAKHHSFDRLGVLAVQAGADLVLVCHSKEHQIAAYEGLLAAVRQGEITLQRLDESVLRIITLKLSIQQQGDSSAAPTH